MLGLTYADSGDFDNATIEFKKAVTLRPEWTWARMWLAIISIFTNDVKTAEEQLFAAEKIENFNKEAHLILGYIYSKGFELEKGITELKGAFDNNPGNQAIGRQLSLMYIFIGQNDNATAVMDELVALYPNVVANYKLLAKAHCQNGNFRMAEKAYIEVIDRANDTRVYLQLADLYIATGARIKAIETYRKAMEYYPNRIDVYINMSSVYFEMGDVASARKLFETLKVNNPSSPEWAFGLGNCCELEGNPDCAIEHYKKALELAPGFGKAELALKKLGKGH